MWQHGQKHCHSVKLTNRAASKSFHSLNCYATGTRLPLSVCFGAPLHLCGRLRHLSCGKWGFFSDVSMQPGRCAIGYKWLATWQKAVLPFNDAVSWNQRASESPLSFFWTNTKDFDLHKEICLVRFWVHWSPKYVLFGSYKRSKIPLLGSLSVFYNAFGRPFSPLCATHVDLSAHWPMSVSFLTEVPWNYCAFKLLGGKIQLFSLSSAFICFPEMRYLETQWEGKVHGRALAHREFNF